MEKNNNPAKIRSIKTYDPSEFQGPFETSDPKLLDEIFKLRAEVWREETKLVDGSRLSDRSELIRDQHENHASHWVITHHNKVVASARMCIHDNIESLPDSHCFLHLCSGIQKPVASINRLVVGKTARGYGFARRFDVIRIEAARHSGAKSVIGDAAPHRVRPLSNLGFRNLGISIKEDWELAEFTLMALVL